MMNSGVSASNASASWVRGWVSTTSCHHTSRPSTQLMSVCPVRLRTSTCSIALSPETAWSACSLTGTALPRRNWPSVVTSSLAPGVLDAEAQRLGGEAAEHQRVDGADAGAGQRDHDGFHQHGQVDDDAVALGDAQGQQRVGRLGHQFLELAVGDGAAVAGLALEVQGHLVPAAGGHVAVGAVHGGVELAAVEPADLGPAPGGGVHRREGVRGVPRLGPFQAAGGVLPERDAFGLGPGFLGGLGAGGSVNGCHAQLHRSWLKHLRGRGLRGCCGVMEPDLSAARDGFTSTKRHRALRGQTGAPENATIAEPPRPSEPRARWV